MLRDLRLRRNWTLQDTVSYMQECDLHMSISTLSWLERGLKHPEYPTLIKLAKFYSVDINQVLYNRVKELRLAKNVTIKQVSDATGIKSETLKSYETGRCDNVLNKNWEKLAEYFDTSVGYVKGYLLDDEAVDEVEADQKEHDLTYKQLDILADSDEVERLREENAKLTMQLEQIQSKYRRIMKSVADYIRDRVDDLEV